MSTALSFDNTESVSDTEMDRLTDTDDGMPTMPREEEGRSPSHLPDDSNESNPTTDSAPPPEPQRSDLFEINVGGKKIQATRDQLIQWSQQGYNYAQQMGAFKQERSQFELDRENYKQERERLKQYEEFDRVARQNPDWWSKIQEQFAYRELPINPQTGQPDPIDQKFAQLRDQVFRQVQEATKPLQDWQKEREEGAKSSARQKLTSDIMSIRNEYPDLDFNQMDVSGKSLELRVLEHMQLNGIKDFRTAFRDFNHDWLINRAQNLAKQEAAKAVQRKTKLGILGESPNPKTRGISQAEDIRNKSYEQLHQEALEELRAMSAG